MKIAGIIWLLLISLMVNAKDSSTEHDSIYEKAYLEIKSILKGEQTYSFKRAVFLTENAYLNNTLSYSKFNAAIDYLKLLCEGFIISNEEGFVYNLEDRDEMIKRGALFNIMTDTIPIFSSLDTIFYHYPYTYDFDDIWGKTDWSKMFVSKLLSTHKGNCHSLPYLYKIVAEEMGIEAQLAFAPNHIYIKHRSKQLGMYNTELTSGTFPIDAWLMASGYIHLDAIRSGIYMESLSDQQAISVCLIDLAQCYERQHGSGGDDFVLNCCETALQYYPNYINGLLLKSEVLKGSFDKIMKENKADYPKDIFHIPDAKDIFNEYESIIVSIHKLGYRRMPEEMYLSWLLDLKENQSTYNNNKIIHNFKTIKPN